MAVPAHLGRLRRLMKLVRSTALKRQERRTARRSAHFGPGRATPACALASRAPRLEGRPVPSSRRMGPPFGRRRAGWLTFAELGSVGHCFPPMDFFLTGGHEALFQAQEKALPCGLLPSQVCDLLERDITPEDYEMLLKLDEGIQRPTADKDVVEALPTACGERFLGESCSICLLPFEKRDTVKVLECEHMFHRDCISKWLEQHKSSCPLCGREVAAGARPPLPARPCQRAS